MKRLSLIIVLLILAFSGFFAWWINGTGAVNSNDKTLKTFVIKNGEGVREVANNLKANSLIKDPIIFFLVIKKNNLDGKIQAGVFKLSPSMDALSLAKALQVGTTDISVTVPEGMRAQEIANILKSEITTFKDSWKSELNLQEGYLFPDTYYLSKKSDIETIISIMNNNFAKKFADAGDNNTKNLSKKEIVTIASLVEREAKFPEDRSLVASVILNRLKQNMALQIDATVQYALGYQPQEKSWWKKNLTIDDLKLNSPYNTYLITGLPPTPISNPGLESLTAVLNAQQTDYLYYISDKSGHNHYAKTLEEHNANIKKYGL